VSNVRRVGCEVLLERMTVCRQFQGRGCSILPRGVVLELTFWPIDAEVFGNETAETRGLGLPSLRLKSETSLSSSNKC